MTDLAQIWQHYYNNVPAQLSQSANIGTVATAFNTNIDAVVKISGKKLSILAQQFELKKEDINLAQTCINTPKDAIRGICKCFINGIAEEWLIDNIATAEWLKKNIPHDRLAMGGQAGIIANLAAVLGVQHVIAHTASLPQTQAAQFLPYDNLFSFDEQGNLAPAHQICRQKEAPLIHQIIEFAKDDVLMLNNKTYTCPKANRFIATYDPANLALMMNDSFVQHINQNGYDYLILSGLHNLTANTGGLKRIEAVVELLQQWRLSCPKGLIHLEMASTQDKTIRRAVVEKIAPLADSLGLNDREALDIIEVIDAPHFAKINHKQPSAADLFDILLKIKNITQTPRIQLHMFGLYITLQNKDYRISAQQNRAGMLTAAVVAASKAGYGKIEEPADLLWVLQNQNGNFNFTALQNLSAHLSAPQLTSTGIFENENYTLIATPTLLINNPKTLVGMGDTISATSLLCAR